MSLFLGHCYRECPHDIVVRVITHEARSVRQLGHLPSEGLQQLPVHQQQEQRGLQGEVALVLEFQTKVHTKVRNHREGPY